MQFVTETQSKGPNNMLGKKKTQVAFEAVVRRETHEKEVTSRSEKPDSGEIHATPLKTHTKE